MIVTLTKDLTILNLFLKSIPTDQHKDVIVGYDGNILKIPDDYKCQFIDVDEFCDEFFFKFTTFKKCILIKHLLEQGHRKFLFCDDDSIIIRPVDHLIHTTVKPIKHVDFSCSEAANAVGFREHHYEAAAFYLSLNEYEKGLYMTMFDEFVKKLKENSHLFLTQNEDINQHNNEIRFANFFSDTMFLNMFLDEIFNIKYDLLVTNYCDLLLQGFASYFEKWLKKTVLRCNILHFSGAPKREFMELYYKVKG